MGLLLLFVGVALGVSFLCSLLEAALLSSSLAMLTDRQKGGSRGSGYLLALKQNRIDDAITSILILNTMANTLGATLAGAQAATVFGSAWVGVFSGGLTDALSRRCTAVNRPAGVSTVSSPRIWGAPKPY